MPHLQTSPQSFTWQYNMPTRPHKIIGDHCTIALLPTDPRNDDNPTPRLGWRPHNNMRLFVKHRNATHEHGCLTNRIMMMSYTNHTTTPHSPSVVQPPKCANSVEPYWRIIHSPRHLPLNIPLHTQMITQHTSSSHHIHHHHHHHPRR